MCARQGRVRGVGSVKSHRKHGMDAKMQGRDNVATTWRLCSTLPLQENVVKLPLATSDSQPWGPRAAQSAGSCMGCGGLGEVPGHTHMPHLHSVITVSGTSILQAPDSAGIDTLVNKECLEESQEEKPLQSAF